MKGADVVMAGIVQYNDWLEEEVRLDWFDLIFRPPFYNNVSLIIKSPKQIKY